MERVELDRARIAGRMGVGDQPHDSPLEACASERHGRSEVGVFGIGQGRLVGRAFVEGGGRLHPVEIGQIARQTDNPVEQIGAGRRWTKNMASDQTSVLSSKKPNLVTIVAPEPPSGVL